MGGTPSELATPSLPTEGTNGAIEPCSATCHSNLCAACVCGVSPDLGRRVGRADGWDRRYRHLGRTVRGIVHAWIVKPVVVAMDAARTAGFQGGRPALARSVRR